jgi:transcriptional regulator with XRE-family HTH domain
MPPRSNPTARQQRMGAELRKLRERAGLSTRDAADLLATNRTLITSTEAGRHGISAERLRRLAHTYGCTDEALITALTRIATDRTKGWWEEFRGILPPAFVDIAELEWFATELRMGTVTHIPGPFQTADFAHALFDAVLPSLPEEQVEARVSHRVQRRLALEKPDAPRYKAIVHEAALLMRFGGRKVMREQLDHILDLMDHENIEVRALPFSAGVFPGAGQAILYAHGEVPQLDTVQLDRTVGPEFLHSDVERSRFGLQLDWMWENALSHDETRSSIHSITQQL